MDQLPTWRFWCLRWVQFCRSGNEAYRGQGNLRLLACGPCDTRAAEDEIQDQVELLRTAMSEGAVGMSR